MTETTTTQAEIKLHAYICDQARFYAVAFEGPNAEAHAIAYINARGATHQFELAYEGQEISHELTKAMFPWAFETCDHGLSAYLCHDPIYHY